MVSIVAEIPVDFQSNALGTFWEKVKCKKMHKGCLILHVTDTILFSKLQIIMFNVRIKFQLNF